MSSSSNLWKAAVGVVLYLFMCIAILCFTAPDYAAIAGSYAQSANPIGKTVAERAICRALRLD